MHFKFYTEFFHDVVESFLLNFTSNNFQVTLSWLDFVSTKHTLYFEPFISMKFVYGIIH